VERFGETQSVPTPETRDPQAERRKQALAELEARLERVREFKPTGNRKQDIEAFLELTGRSRDYLEAFRTRRADPVETMREIRDFLEKSLDPSNEFYHALDEHDPDYPVKHKFYREIPQAELHALDAILRQGEAPPSGKTRSESAKLQAERVNVYESGAEKNDRLSRLREEKKKLQRRLVEIDEELRASGELEV